MSLTYSVLADRFLPNIIVNTRPALYKLYIFPGQPIDGLGINLLAN